MTAAQQNPDLAPLIQRFNEGDETAMEALVTTTYASILLPMAQKFLRNDSIAHVLEPNELISETWPRLKRMKVNLNDRDHFCKSVKIEMQRALFDLVRYHRAPCRGGDANTRHYSYEQLVSEWVNS